MKTKKTWGDISAELIGVWLALLVEGFLLGLGFWLAAVIIKG
jgi:hypothetical protein